jgi:short subunit dehydrogenase-like uncharacterized protein
MSEQFDIVIFGATSFVGEILTGYMMQQYGSNGEVKWAIAGRSETKLNAIKDLHNAQDIPHIVADAANQAQLKDMVAQARVIVSTVGPYALYGEPLVKDCAETGTDYCDLTGEVQWYKRMVEKYQAVAEKSGARIVHCSGFDSIPSDMGVFFLQQHAYKKFGKYSNNVTNRIVKILGGASGGTVASMTNVVKEAAKDPALRKELKNPYSICPSGHGFKVRQQNVSGAEFDTDLNAWIGPFVMAAVNERVVHRSNALLDNAYGTEFKYSEAMMMGKGSKGKSRARFMAWGLNIFMVLAALAPTRWLLEKFVLPNPGEGPSPKDQKEGMYDMRFTGKMDSGNRVKVKVTGDRDPGYGSTAKMLGEAAVCLALLPKAEKTGGFWTPSSAYGMDLVERLTKNAGLTFEVLES